MSTKRPPSKTSAPTDEWGIYDPAKAGMPALFARLGRPILRAAPTNSRRERRRAQRPERPAEGVGLAIAEARRRAGLDRDIDETVEHPLVGGNPARAMRLALRAQAAVTAMGTPAVEPFVPPMPVPAPPAPVDARGVEPMEAPATPAPKKRVTRKAAQARSTSGAPASEAEAKTSKPRSRKATAKGRVRQAAPVADVTPPAEAASAVATAAVAVPEAAPVPRPQGPPAPSPRRPRGPVPLAAWAHAVADQPQIEPRRADKRGFWRGLFRIPAEVALVEYAHGARIHRLLIDAGDDLLSDFI
jgi:hypothetical protein